MSGPAGRIAEEGPGSGPVIRDKRRIDPITGEPRRPPGPVGPDAPASTDAPAGPDAAVTTDDLLDDELIGSGGDGLVGARELELEAQLAERTGDLQRVQAEFANYRRRIDRDRELGAQVAVANTLAKLLPVLDDVDRARTHGDLTGAFKAVADGLDALLAAAGVEAFGAEGDGFDPNIHEAVTHDTSADVAFPTATMVMRRGYRLGDRVLRPAMVGVTDPGQDDAAS